MFNQSKTEACNYGEETKRNWGEEVELHLEGKVARNWSFQKLFCVNQSISFDCIEYTYDWIMLGDLLLNAWSVIVTKISSSMNLLKKCVIVDTSMQMTNKFALQIRSMITHRACVSPVSNDVCFQQLGLQSGETWFNDLIARDSNKIHKWTVRSMFM